MTDAIELNASTEDDLAAAVEGLAAGLSEFDPEGLASLGKFAADCGCSPRRDGDKVIFTKGG
ncbi:hypothetical protein M2171_005264 [Bradyrhizobium japonicum USDA 38]|uniref:hypothetical protein n=1 Tax=Bradyrhizobium japonicum TaxID=375 RepID=UPI000407F894|nr:hypothetical protein [Bradyrhizobium japonicum]MCS3896131.1 hypothetical protein [Bradyrhizobium japonicum USDA 38]MCS3948645.1 hypothetical protein [Bradyrhizobium japonicum]MCW2218622.1 hypothetical protein [Bradyrhizobium japonicum]MCW2343236.1 hypothetical protein [Bradyrhizobium japonicum]